ncbi:MAG: DHH family phosphoesterase [Holdemania massiliensis]
MHLDHHPQIEHFAEYEYVIDSYAATCEILAEFFFSVDQEPLEMDVAEYLYRGLLTDTLSFRPAIPQSIRWQWPLI